MHFQKFQKKLGEIPQHIPINNFNANLFIWLFFSGKCFIDKKTWVFRQGRTKKKTSNAQISLMIWTSRLVKNVWTLHLAEGPIPSMVW